MGNKNFLKNIIKNDNSNNSYHLLNLFYILSVYSYLIFKQTHEIAIINYCYYYYYHHYLYFTFEETES